MLLPPSIFALVARPVGPGFQSAAVLVVVLPVTLIFRPVFMNVFPEPVSLVELPLALEDVAIDVPELALPVCLSVEPAAIVLGPVRP